jgi:signal transduction histidine kinase
MTSVAGLQSAAAVDAVLPTGLPNRVLSNTVSPKVALNTIAHELRQPLGTIESIAYYLTLVLPREDDRAREQVVRVQQLIQQSNWILTCGLQLADETPLAPEPVDLGELITQTVSRRASHGDPRPRLHLAAELPLVMLDPARGSALLENLLLLCLLVASEAHPVHVRTSVGRGGCGALLEISTSAPGYRSEGALGPGSALGLESARRVIAAHGGSLSIDVDPASGIRLQAVLP